MNVKLSDSGIYHNFTWEVQNFFSLPSETGFFLQSDEFCFAGNLYCLRLYPFSTDDDEDYVDIVLVRLPSSVPYKDISYEIGCKLRSREEFKFIRCDDSRNAVDLPVGNFKFSVLRFELEKMSSTYVPHGILTVYCDIRMSKLSVLPLDGEEEQKGLSGVDKLLSDYKRLLLKGAESDTCLVVSGKEFQVHRCILRARSPVFEAMFSHEMAEKESGRVVIDDLKPDRFEDFLKYLYTGRVESFSDDNVFGMYAAADKYDVPTLKSECVEFMNRSLSVANFCDVITLALKHREKDLKDLAVQFFKENVAKIILTVKWQQFMSENSMRANELFIKVHVRGKESENVLLL